MFKKKPRNKKRIDSKIGIKKFIKQLKVFFKSVIKILPLIDYDRRQLSDTTLVSDKVYFPVSIWLIEL